MKTYDEAIAYGVWLALKADESFSVLEFAHFMSGFDAALGFMFDKSGEVVGDDIRAKLGIEREAQKWPI